MLKKSIAIAGLLFLVSFSLSAQTANTQKVERTNPINDYTPENKQYQKDHTGVDRTGISKDPVYRHATTAADEKAKARAEAVQSPPAADSTAAPAEKKKPQR